MLKSDHLDTILQAYGLRPEATRFLRSSQNDVYCAEDGDAKRIVRISTGRHRSKAQVEAELAWISFLARRGIKVCSSIPAVSGDPCPAFEFDGELHVVTCFEHALGKEITSEDLHPSLYRKLGSLVAQMHLAAIDFNSSDTVIDRPAWHESRLLREDIGELGEALTTKFRESVGDLIKELRAIPATAQNYGPIHGDVSFGNCFLHEGELWLFDFDNCEYGFFVQELATVLYDSIYCRVLQKFADSNLTTRMAPLWNEFLSGYASAGLSTKIDRSDLKNFFLLREAIIYIHYHRVLDLRSIDDSFRAGLEVMRRNVEDRNHQVDFEALLLGAS